MEILKLIKKCGSIRKFKKNKIEDKAIKLILEAGVWGPSVFGIQPWHFVVIKKQSVIKKISLIVNKDACTKRGGIEKLLLINGDIIRNSKILIAIYTNNRVKKSSAKYGVTCMKKGWIAELLSTGAATQNMFLALNSLGLGGVWLDAPTIFSKKINKILNEKDELLAFLAFGYPNQKARRSNRNFDNIVKFI